MVVTHNMCSDKYNSYTPKLNERYILPLTRRITGAMLKAQIAGATPANGDSYKVMQISKHQLAYLGFVAVIDADDTSDAMTVGYTDGTNTSANGLLASVNLNSAAVTALTGLKLFDDNGYYITVTIPNVSDLDDATEFVITVMVVDLSLTGIETVLTTPI